MIHITSIKPLFTSIVTTGDTFEEDMVSNGIIVAKKGDLKMWQTVIGKGSSVREIEVGEKVMINFDNFAVKKYNKNSVQNDLDNNPVLTYHFNWVTIDDEEGKPHECLLMQDRDILYAFKGEEKDDLIVTPGNPSIVL